MARRHTSPVEARVRAYLHLSFGQPRDVHHMAWKLNHPNVPHLRQVCAQLAAQGVIEACGTGRYRLPREGTQGEEGSHAS